MSTSTQSAKTPSKSKKESSNSRQTRAENQSATIVDERPATLAQNNIIASMGSGSGAQKTAQLQAIMGGTAPVQRVKEDKTQIKDTSVENNTGLPDQLKSGIENISGISLNDVRVHPNSSQPGELSAHAFAQGTDIHLAPGQEKNLPHEAWHVVQQKQGRVQPTKQVGDGVNVNDHQGLEHEATQMGQRALNHTPQTDTPNIQSVAAPSATAQLMPFEDDVALKTGKPMNKEMKQTARNQFGLNDEIKRFDKSNLKKRPSPPKAKRRNAMKPQTPKVTANLANALGGVAEKDKRGDATMGAVKQKGDPLGDAALYSAVGTGLYGGALSAINNETLYKTLGVNDSFDALDPKGAGDGGGVMKGLAGAKIVSGGLQAASGLQKASAGTANTIDNFQRGGFQKNGKKDLGKVSRAGIQGLLNVTNIGGGVSSAVAAAETLGNSKTFTEQGASLARTGLGGASAASQVAGGFGIAGGALNMAQGGMKYWKSKQALNKLKTKKGKNEKFEDEDYLRMQEIMQRKNTDAKFQAGTGALDTAAGVANFVPGLGTAIGGGIALTSAGIKAGRAGYKMKAQDGKNADYEASLNNEQLVSSEKDKINANRDKFAQTDKLSGWNPLNWKSKLGARYGRSNSYGKTKEEYKTSTSDAVTNKAIESGAKKNADTKTKGSWLSKKTGGWLGSSGSDSKYKKEDGKLKKKRGWLGGLKNVFTGEHKGPKEATNSNSSPVNPMMLALQQSMPGAGAVASIWDGMKGIKNRFSAGKNSLTEVGDAQEEGAKKIKETDLWKQSQVGKDERDNRLVDNMMADKEKRAIMLGGDSEKWGKMDSEEQRKYLSKKVKS